MASLFPSSPTSDLSKEYTFQTQSSGTPPWTANVLVQRNPNRSSGGDGSVATKLHERRVLNVLELQHVQLWGNFRYERPGAQSKVTYLNWLREWSTWTAEWLPRSIQGPDSATGITGHLASPSAKHFPYSGKQSRHNPVLVAFTFLVSPAHFNRGD